MSLFEQFDDAMKYIEWYNKTRAKIDTYEGAFFVTVYSRNDEDNCIINDKNILT